MAPRLTRRFQRFRRAPRAGEVGEAGESGELVELESVELTGVFAAPQWLRDLGFASWLLAGAGVVLIGLVWLASLTSTIVMPVTVAAVLAAVLAPCVSFLARKGLPRGFATLIVFIVLAVFSTGIAVMIIGGITGEASSLASKLGAAADKIQGWLVDLGIDPKTAQEAQSDAASGLDGGFQTLLHGVASGVEGFASVAVFLSFMLLSLFFLLKDGPTIRRWVERHLALPAPVASIVVGRTLSSMRGYFAGVTIISLFNGVVIGFGAFVLGVPNAASIAVVNFVAAYIPYLGAWAAGAFTVLLALGSSGTETAVVMIVIVLLANGALQQLVQPLAMGAALGIHPLAVLIVTIGAGALFGTIGMIVAAPLTSAAVKISADLAAHRKEAADDDANPAAGAEFAFDPAAS